MDISTLIVIGSVVISVMTGALAALASVAPHTETRVDDKIVEYGDKALPVMVRILDYLRARKA